ALTLSQDRHSFLNEVFMESSGLPHKSFNYCYMILREHRWYWIIFRAKIKQGKEIVILASDFILLNVNVAILVQKRVGIYFKILECKCFAIIEFLLALRVDRVAVKYGVTNIGAFTCKGNIIRICRRAHCEHESSVTDKLFDLFCDCAFFFTNFLIAEFMRGCFEQLNLCNVPRCGTITAIELAVLACEIFMVQV